MTTPTVAEVVARLRAMRSGVQLRSPVYAVSESPLRDVADLLESEHKARVEAEARPVIQSVAIEDWIAYTEMKDRAETAERELAALRNRPCPYVHSSGEGTHYCTLAGSAEHTEVREQDGALDEIVGRGEFHLEQLHDNAWWMNLGGVCVSLRTRGRGKIIGTVIEDRRQATHRVAILPLGEGE